MNIFTKLITYDKNGKCENPFALEEKQQKERVAYKARIEGRLKISNYEETRSVYLEKCTSSYGENWY